MKQKLANKSIVFFDGNCGLCSRSINFIIKHDAHGRFLLCPLQSNTAKNYLNTGLLNAETVVLLENEKVYTESEAAFRILYKLKTVWKFLLIFRYFPLSFTNAVYRWVARNRKKWFPDPDTCQLPSPEVMKRIIRE